MSPADIHQSSARDAGLGPLLVTLRTKRGLAQKQVAHLADIDGSTLSRLESGDRGVSREVLERICKVLELDRKERLDVLVAAGFLTDEAARFLADEELAHLAHLLTDPHTAVEDVARLRQFVALALAYAAARGYARD
jgi:transcriptional regulator with XRE-family HTH domain